MIFFCPRATLPADLRCRRKSCSAKPSLRQRMMTKRRTMTLATRCTHLHVQFNHCSFYFQMATKAGQPSSDQKKKVTPELF